MKKLVQIKKLVFDKIKKLDSLNTFSVKEVDDYIKSLGVPRDLIERSYYQYLCQKKHYSQSVCYNILYFSMNFFAFIVLVVLLLIPSTFLGRLIKKQNSDAICMFNESLEDRIPHILYDEFKIDFLTKKKFFITAREKKFLLQIWARYPFSMNFVLKNMLKIGFYRYSIECSKNLKAIIASCEYSYTSSILTEYCRQMNIEHINIMHGEIVVELVKAFFEFDRFYVWDEYYIDLCVNRMVVKSKQFLVAIPPCLKFNVTRDINKFDLKYYFQTHSKEQILKVKKILDSLSENYMVRVHPLANNKEYVRLIFNSEQIESNEITIENSIMEAKCVIAWDSTVLFQAYLNNKMTIIDDVSNVERSAYVKEAGYIMSSKSIPLSQIREF